MLKIKSCAVVLTLSLFLSGCAGKRISQYDEFTGVKTNALTLGSSESSGPGLINSTGFSIAYDSNNPNNYYFIVDVYSEGSGKDCPRTTAGNNVIFLVDSKRINSKVLYSSHPKEMMMGIISPSCQELGIKIGYFNKNDLVQLSQANTVKFKIYATQRQLEAKFDEEQLKLISDFIKNKI